MARIKVLSLRKSGQAQILQLDSQGLLVDEKQLHINQVKINLSKIQFNIMYELMRKHPAPVKNHELEFAIWGNDIPESNSLNVHIFHLRKVLKKYNANIELKNQISIGYRLLSL